MVGTLIVNLKIEYLLIKQ